MFIYFRYFLYLRLQLSIRRGYKGKLLDFKLQMLKLPLEFYCCSLSCLKFEVHNEHFTRSSLSSLPDEINQSHFYFIGFKSLCSEL